MIEEVIPVITVDGPSGSGKGTICRLLARELGWHLLDSGALYRVTALAARNHGVAFSDHQALEVLAGHLDVQFETGADGTEDGSIILEGEDVTDLVRTEETGALASEVAVIPVVRSALLQRQRAFRSRPGLVADGRDMGTVVFPSPAIKIYLTASADERAERRFLQLQGRGENVTLPRLIADIKARDKRDMERAVAPLRPAEDAITVDTTGVSIDDVFRKVMDAAAENGLI